MEDLAEGCGYLQLPHGATLPSQAARGAPRNSVIGAGSLGTGGVCDAVYRQNRELNSENAPVRCEYT